MRGQMCVLGCLNVWMCGCVRVCCVGVVFVVVCCVWVWCMWVCLCRVVVCGSVQPWGGAVESVCTHHNEYFICSAHPQGRLGETTLLETADSTLTSGVADMPTDNAAKIHTIVPDEPPHRCCPCPNRSERTRGPTAGQTMGLRGLGRQRPPVEAPHHVVDHRGKAVRQREAGPVLGHTQHRTPMPLW